MSDSSASQGLQTSRLLCPWDFPRQNTRVGCNFPEDLPDPGIEPASLARQADSLPRSHLGSLFCPWRGPKCSSREPIVGCILLLTFYCLSASSHCISKPLSKVICGRELKFGLCLAQEVYQYAFSVKKKNHF